MSDNESEASGDDVNDSEEGTSEEDAFKTEEMSDNESETSGDDVNDSEEDASGEDAFETEKMSDNESEASGDDVNDSEEDASGEDDIIAEGSVDANPQFGEGGGNQYFIRDFGEMTRDGRMQKIAEDEILHYDASDTKDVLDSTKSSDGTFTILKDDRPISDEELKQLDDNTADYPYENDDYFHDDTSFSEKEIAQLDEETPDEQNLARTMNDINRQIEEDRQQPFSDQEDSGPDIMPDGFKNPRKLEAGEKYFQIRPLNAEHDSPYVTDEKTVNECRDEYGNVNTKKLLEKLQINPGDNTEWKLSSYEYASGDKSNMERRTPSTSLEEGTDSFGGDYQNSNMQDANISDTKVSFENLAEYMNSHNYGPDDFATYSQDPQWRQLMRQEYPDYELPELSQESANAQLSQYMNDHNYGVDDYAEYSQDPTWRELHSAAYPDDEVSDLNEANNNNQRTSTVSTAENHPYDVSGGGGDKPPICPVCGQTPCVCNKNEDIASSHPVCPVCGKYPCICDTRDDQGNYPTLKSMENKEYFNDARTSYTKAEDVAGESELKFYKAHDMDHHIDKVIERSAEAADVYETSPETKDAVNPETSGEYVSTDNPYRERWEEFADEFSDGKDESEGWDSLKDVPFAGDTSPDASKDASAAESTEASEMPEINSISDYMNAHNYGVDDYAEYSQDPVWRELHSAAFPDDELPPLSGTNKELISESSESEISHDADTPNSELTEYAFNQELDKEFEEDILSDPDLTPEQKELMLGYFDEANHSDIITEEGESQAGNLMSDILRPEQLDDKDFDSDMQESSPFKLAMDKSNSVIDRYEKVRNNTALLNDNTGYQIAMNEMSKDLEEQVATVDLAIAENDTAVKAAEEALRNYSPEMETSPLSNTKYRELVENLQSTRGQSNQLRSQKGYLESLKKEASAEVSDEFKGVSFKSPGGKSFNDTFSELINEQGVAYPNEIVNDCGVCTMGNMANQHGGKFTEKSGLSTGFGEYDYTQITDDMSPDEKAYALKHNGLTSLDSQVNILNKMGYEAVKYESGATFEDIVANISKGNSMSLNLYGRDLNSGSNIAKRPGRIAAALRGQKSVLPANHAVTIAGLAVNPSGKPIGFFVNDTGGYGGKNNPSIFISKAKYAQMLRRTAGISSIICTGKKVFA